MKSWLSALISLIIGSPSEKDHSWADILLVLGVVGFLCAMLAIAMV